MTVSNVVNGRPGPAPATRRRVEEAIRELGYVRDAGAHALRVGRATALGFLMEDESRLALHDPVHAALLTGMVERARHRGLTVAVLVASPETIDAQVERVVRERRVGGLLLSLQGTPDRHAALLERLGADGVPAVVFEQTASVRGVHSIASDNEGGGRAVAGHLTGLGHRRIAVLTGDVPWPGGERRLAGFREVARAAGAELLEWRTPEWNAAAARDAARARLAGERPTAVFAANDLLAVGVLHAAEDAGLRVPARPLGGRLRRPGARCPPAARAHDRARRGGGDGRVGGERADGHPRRRRDAAARRAPGQRSWCATRPERSSSATGRPRVKGARRPPPHAGSAAGCRPHPLRRAHRTGGARDPRCRQRASSRGRRRTRRSRRTPNRGRRRARARTGRAPLRVQSLVVGGAEPEQRLRFLQRFAKRERRTIDLAVTREAGTQQQRRCGRDRPVAGRTGGVRAGLRCAEIARVKVGRPQLDIAFAVGPGRG